MDTTEDLRSLIKLTVAPDKMTATLQLSSGDTDEKALGQIFSDREAVYKTIYEMMSDQGISYGIQDQSIRSLVDHPVFFAGVIIAQGEEPQQGEDGKEEFFFRKTIPLTFPEDEHGRVNYRELNLIESVSKGMVLYRWTEPTIGASGHNVFGTELPGILGRTVKAIAGPGTVMDEENRLITADSDGQVTWQNDKISVQNIYEVKGDVDLAVGNIYFKGTVHIKGDVREGFRIMAEGDVLVDGGVEGAQINARGKIIIKNGINGMTKGLLKAGGDIVCRYIENSTIQSKGNVSSEVIINSKIVCSGNLELNGPRGHFISGECMVGGLISAKNFGTENSGGLVLNFGYRDGFDCTVEQSYQAAQRDFDECKRKVDFYISMSKKMKLNEKHQSEFERLLIRYKELDNEVQELQAQTELEHKKMEKAYRLLISVAGTMYTGVRINVGHLVFRATNDITYSHFWLDRGEIHYDTGTIVAPA